MPEVLTTEYGSVAFMKTSEPITRYVAADNPNLWVENEKLALVHVEPEPYSYKGPQTNGGFEFAVYDEPWHNPTYPDLKDGIHVQIVSYQGKSYLLDCHATMPTHARDQFGCSARFALYEQAKLGAMLWIAQMKIAYIGRPPDCRTHKKPIETWPYFVPTVFPCAECVRALPGAIL